MNPGSHSVKWNGLDKNNKKVSSGVYVYKMISGENISSLKMVLAKQYLFSYYKIKEQANFLSYKAGLLLYLYMNVARISTIKIIVFYIISSYFVLNAHDLDEAAKIIAGSAKSMGIEVKE